MFVMLTTTGKEELAVALYVEGEPATLKTLEGAEKTILTLVLVVLLTCA